MASSSRSASVPPQSSSDTQSMCNTKKLPVEVNTEGLLVGPNYAKWGTRAGYFIRSCIPVYFSDWRDVPRVFKDNLWRCLMDEFTLNVLEEVARPWLEKGFPPKWRVIKSRYRSKIIRQCESLEAAKATCPNGVDPNHWADFVTANANPKVQEKYATNAESRKKRKDYNTLGRQTFAQRVHILNEKNPQKKQGRTDAWLDVHELLDGTILQCSRQQYELVKAFHEKDNGVSDTNNNHLLIDCDALTEVFGKDKGSRTRGTSSFISNKEVQRTALTKVLLEQAEAENLKSKIQNSDNASRLDTLESLMMNVLQNKTNSSGNSQPAGGVNRSPRADDGSTSIPFPSQPNPQNMMNLFGQRNLRTRPTANPKVNLLARDGAIVAKGFVETNETSGICHGKKVLHFERKVFVEEVLDENAPIYDRPQDGNHILQDVIEGGYLIWPDEMLQYI